MRYYVTADVHGYFSELKNALEDNGFFEDQEPHKLIVCGDLYDRGTLERILAVKVSDFLVFLVVYELFYFVFILYLRPPGSCKY